MDYVGKNVRITKDVQLLRRNAVSNALRMNSNSPSSDVAIYAGMEGKIIGYSGGRDYGDGMYDPALYIVQIQLTDGSVRALRLDVDLVEIC